MSIFFLRALLAASLALPAAEPPWIEVVSLDRPHEPPVLVPVAADGRSVPLPESVAGWTVVCFGGDPGGIACAKRLLVPGERLLRPAGPARMVVGRVVSGREAVPGARVALFLAGLEARRPHLVPLGLGEAPPRRPIHEIVSAADGIFVLPPLVAGEYRIQMTAPWGQQLSSPPFTVEIAPERGTRGPPGPLDLGELALPAGVELVVEVVDHEARPLAGARVGLTQGESGFSAGTDFAGRARLRGLDPEAAVSISCSAEGHARRRLRLAAPTPLVHCALDPFAEVAGRVTGGGEPLFAATATLDGGPPDETGRRVRRATAADEVGSFRFGAVPAGSYRLIAVAPGFVLHEVDVELAPGETRELPTADLVPARELLGVVVAAGSGEPIGGASVVALDPLGAVATTSDDEGRFAWTAGGEREVVLEVGAEGFAAVRRRVSPESAARDEPLVVRLERPGRIALVARRASGDPCVGCDFAAGLYAQPGLPETPIHRLRTDAAGRAESPALPPGRYLVTREVTRSLGAGVTVRAGDDNRDIRVLPDVVTEVSFVEGAETLHVRPWPPVTPGWRLSAVAADGRRVYDADPATGAWVVERSPGTEVSLELVSDGASVVVARLSEDFSDPNLDLAIPRTRVVGRIVDGADGGGPRELRAIGVGAGATRGWWAIGGDGHFELLHLAAGVYTLTVDDRVLASFALGEGDRLDVGDLAVDGGQ